MVVSCCRMDSAIVVRCYEPSCSKPRPIPGQIGRSQFENTFGVPVSRRGPPTSRDRDPQRTSQNDGFPAALYVRKMRYDRKARRQPLSVELSASEAAALPFGLRGAGEGLSIFL